MQVRVIVTAPPYAPFLSELAAHPLVGGLRLNTVMPLAETPGEALARLTGIGPPLWVDLKGRQLRVMAAAVPPFTEVLISHRIRVRTPADAFFDDGREHARVVAVEGDRLILEDGPRRVIGPGESVNVVDPSLEIEGTLTDTDRDYLEAMKAVGLRKVMLSYVERPEDVEEVRSILPDAELVLKIESRRGLAFAAKHGARLGRLMAARGDLYVEVVEPHRIVGALRGVIRADPEAIVGSRLFPSLSRHPVPEAADVTDAAFLMALGYRTFLLGDEVCLRRDSVMEALNLLAAVAGEM
ncbi:MAG TPA: pyruvate kinase [Thermoanaerobaculia bacterium]|nr:pyruvate kinase [Thermoanaerobaculia bacterium]